MTHEQHATYDRLAVKHGRVCVSDGYLDGTIRVTVPSGAEYIVPPHGRERLAGTNFSVNWSYDA